MSAENKTGGSSAKGFAAMDKDRLRELARQGGRACHALGLGHQWTPEEAKAAGRKGGATGRQRAAGRRAAAANVAAAIVD
jgi:general stress protein YciG